jgi:hypothetical protein
VPPPSRCWPPPVCGRRPCAGSWCERAEIERRSPNRTSDLPRGIAGARLVPRRDGMDVQLRAGGLLSMMGKRADDSCLPPVFLDGLLVSHTTPDAGPVDRGVPNRWDIDSLRWGDIEPSRSARGPRRSRPGTAPRTARAASSSSGPGSRTAT